MVKKRININNNIFFRCKYWSLSYKLIFNKVANIAISILRVFMTIENEFYARLIINPIIFLIALFFCLKKDISYFNFLGLTGFLCLIYLVSVIVLQTKSYSDIYWK